MNLWSDKMEILNILSDHVILFSVLIGILVINFSCIIYLVMGMRLGVDSQFFCVIFSFNFSSPSMSISIIRGFESPVLGPQIPKEYIWSIIFPAL